MIFADSTAGVLNITLPVSTTIPSGFTKRITIRRYDSSANACNVVRQGSDVLIAAGVAVGAVTSLAIAAQGRMILVASPGGWWVIG
jgi:hypothetical protein